MHWRPNEEPPRASGRLGPDIAFLLFEAFSWTAGTLLASLGLFVAVFLAIGDGRFGLFMAHLNNLASRYEAATPDVRAGFAHEVACAFAIVSGLLFAVRLPFFVMRLRAEFRRSR